MNAKDFLGLTKKRAQDLAEKQGMIFRLIRIDQNAFFDYPEELIEDRICVEIDSGQVTKAVIH